MAPFSIKKKSSRLLYHSLKYQRCFFEIVPQKFLTKNAVYFSNNHRTLEIEVHGFMHADDSAMCVIIQKSTLFYLSWLTTWEKYKELFCILSKRTLISPCAGQTKMNFSNIVLEKRFILIYHGCHLDRFFFLFFSLICCFDLNDVNGIGMSSIFFELN